MLVSYVWLLIFSVAVYARQEPRKRPSEIIFDDPSAIARAVMNEDITCTYRNCFKRSGGQEELGPFWANRGKRDPNYSREQLYVEEPRWILVRRFDRNINDNEPFFVARGKKYDEDGVPWKSDSRLPSYKQLDEKAFFAARGKKNSLE